VSQGTLEGVGLISDTIDNVIGRTCFQRGSRASGFVQFSDASLIQRVLEDFGLVLETCDDGIDGNDHPADAADCVTSQSASVAMSGTFVITNLVCDSDISGLRDGFVMMNLVCDSGFGGLRDGFILLRLHS
jgi:hypothetical protein